MLSSCACEPLTTPPPGATDDAKLRIDNKKDEIASLEKNIEHEKEELENITSLNQDILGDIVISINKVEEQAIEYGHSFERELAYMVTDSNMKFVVTMQKLDVDISRKMQQIELLKNFNELMKGKYT